MNTFLLILGTFGFLLICFSISRYFNKKIDLEFIVNFSSYIAVLQYHMDKAYDMIHKDRILIYSLESVKPSEDEIILASKDFSKLVLRFLGPRMERNLMYLYGDKETLVLNLIDYFNTKFDDDEIRQKSVDNMINQNNDQVSAEATLSGLLNKR